MAQAGNKRRRTPINDGTLAADPDTTAVAAPLTLPDIGAAKQRVLAHWRTERIPAPHTGAKVKSLAENLAGPFETKTKQRREEQGVRAIMRMARKVNKDTGDGILHSIASSLFDEECVKTAVEYIEAGADIHARNKTGRTPLHAAALHGCLQYATLLVELGANPAACDDCDDSCVELQPVGAKGAGFFEMWSTASEAARRNGTI